MFFLSTLIWSLAFPDLIFANTPVYNEQEIELIVSKYNEDSSTLKQMIQKIGTIEVQKAKELEDLIKSEGVDLNTTAPKLVYQNNTLALESHGKKFNFEFFEKDSIKVSYEKKSVLLHSKMSPSNVKTELMKLFDTKVSFSFLDLIISKASAELVIVTAIMLAAAAVFLLTAVVAIFDAVFTTRDLNHKAERVHKMCNDLENSTPSELSLTKDVVQSYNSIASSFSFHCARSEALSSACKQVKEAKECLKKSIQKANGSNDSGRSSSKKIEYDSTRDEYHQVIAK